MRDEALIQISYEASLFSANHNPLKRKTEKDTRGGSAMGRGASREKLRDELRGPLAGALRVIDKSEEVMWLGWARWGAQRSASRRDNYTEAQGLTWFQMEWKSHAKHIIVMRRRGIALRLCLSIICGCVVDWRTCLSPKEFKVFSCKEQVWGHETVWVYMTTKSADVKQCNCWLCQQWCPWLHFLTASKFTDSSEVRGIICSKNLIYDWT